jgi:hypothetical protein
MSPTLVRREQFRISPKGITHTPTGATYIPHPGAPHCGITSLGQLGSVLPSGEDYLPHEVQTIMEQLWEDYVTANRRARAAARPFGRDGFSHFGLIRVPPKTEPPHWPTRKFPNPRQRLAVRLICDP